MQRSRRACQDQVHNNLTIWPAQPKRYFTTDAVPVWMAKRKSSDWLIDFSWHMLTCKGVVLIQSYKAIPSPNVDTILNAIYTLKVTSLRLAGNYDTIFLLRYMLLQFGWFVISSSVYRYWPAGKRNSKIQSPGNTGAIGFVYWACIVTIANAL